MGLFDDMDSFETDNGFGDSNSSFDDTFGDDFGSNAEFGNSNSFDSANTFGSNDVFDSNSFESNDSFGGSFSDDGGADFSGSFDDDGTLGQNNGDSGGGLKKQAIITAAVGIIGIVLIFFIASKISSCSKQEEVDSNSNQSAVQATDRNGQNVNDIMSNNKVDRPTSNNQNNNQSNSQNTNKKEDDWIYIDKSQNVEFNTEYQELMFTVTNIQHLAKKVDINGNLVVKTQLTGSISGLTGSYTLDIPYSKGVKLVVGDSFTVNVQLGTYSGKTVVGEIIY